ncbi:hypothetical protein GCM10028807_43470 [Spirosoma daeguense]
MDEQSAPPIFYERGNQRFVNLEFVKFLADNDLILESPRGGLLLGPSHEEGGIQVIAFANKECFWIDQYQGWEYLMNPFATQSNQEELQQINTSSPQNGLSFEPYEVSANITTLDCRPVMIHGFPFAKWLLVGGVEQQLITREATKQHLDHLNSINESTWQKIQG